MRLTTLVIDTMIVAATVAWAGALLWWWQRGLHGLHDALLVFGLLLISITFVTCIFSK